jgi:hypothetical protein
VPNVTACGPQLSFAVQILDRVVDALDGDDLDTLHDGSFRRVFCGHEQRPETFGPAMQRHGQHAPHWAHTAIERQLTQDDRASEALGLDETGRTEEPERHRQVERCALLGETGGGEIDRDAIHGELETGIADGGPDAIPAFPHGRIR